MSDADDVARDLLALPFKVMAATHGVVVRFGAKLEAEVKRNASASRSSPRPLPGGGEGPRALTGGYRRSISRRTVRRVGGSTTYVGTNDVRARALEFGNPSAFGGTRETYPYPHYGPALDSVSEPFAAAVGEAANSAIRKDRT